MPVTHTSRDSILPKSTCMRVEGESPTAQQGMALIMALLFTVILSGMTISGTLLLRAHMEKTRVSFGTNSQALHIARSGLTEGLNWLRRQTSQPVLDFAPELDAAATPPVLDTIDPDIGLVREFRITGRTWARYEVWKQWAGDPVPTRLAWRQQVQCLDVSRPRADATPGTMWQLRSVGYVYDRADPTLAFDQAPNRVLASQFASTEVRRVVIGLPGQAAVNVGDGNSCHINTNGRITGGSGAGIYYPSGTGTPTTGPASANRVTGSPSLSATTQPYDDSYEGVFNSSLDELKAMANLVVTDTADFPTPVPEMGLLVVDAGTLQIDADHALRGTGIVIIRGNVVMTPGNNSLFSGLLYVDGNLTVREPCEINGSVICTGNLTVQGASDYATINFDSAILSTLMTRIGNYRLASATLLPRKAQ
jgi:hypothetical protein